MCFTPAVSLTTAILEIAIASFLFLKFKRTILIKFLISFIIILGIYQFTEFMLCTTTNQFWANFGIIAYTFLPAIGLHFWFSCGKEKTKPSFLLIYLLPVAFSIYALMKSNFILSSVCERYYVTVVSLFTNGSLLGVIYWTYYLGFIIFILINAIKEIKCERKGKNRVQLILLVIAILATLIPPVVLFLIFPQIGISFPSIYCQFAFLFSVFAIIVARLES